MRAPRFNTTSMRCGYVHSARLVKVTRIRLSALWSIVELTGLPECWAVSLTLTRCPSAHTCWEIRLGSPYVGSLDSRIYHAHWAVGKRKRAVSRFVHIGVTQIKVESSLVGEPSNCDALREKHVLWRPDSYTSSRVASSAERTARMLVIAINVSILISLTNR